MVPWMIFTALWLIALGIETGLREVRQHPRMTTTLLGTNVSFTCWNQNMNSTTCSNHTYIYCFIRNPNVCYLYPKSMAQSCGSQSRNISVTCDKKSNIVTVFLTGLLISDSDTYYCRLSSNGNVKDGTGTQILVYGGVSDRPHKVPDVTYKKKGTHIAGGISDRPHKVPDVTYKKKGTHIAESLYLTEMTNNNTIMLLCSTVISSKGNFTIRWKRDEDVLHWMLYNSTFKTIGDEKHTKSILTVDGPRSRNTKYSCQLWFQDDVLQERTVTLYATGKGPEAPLLLYILLLSSNMLLLITVSIVFQCRNIRASRKALLATRLDGKVSKSCRQTNHTLSKN